MMFQRFGQDSITLGGREEHEPKALVRSLSGAAVADLVLVQGIGDRQTLRGVQATHSS